MNKFEKQFIDGILEQIAQARVSLDECKKAMDKVDEKYRLLAEQEKKDLKEQEASLRTIITVLDTSTVSVYGKSATSFIDDNSTDESSNESEIPATFEEGARIPETDDLSEIEALKKKLEESDKKDNGDDFDVDKTPAPEVENPQPEQEAEEEAEANDEVEQIAQTIEDDDDWGDDDSDSKENDPFGSFDDWPDVDEQFK